MNRDPVFAIILCAGASSRFGGGRSKLLAPLGGRRVLEHTLEAFAKVPVPISVGLVFPASQEESFAPFFHSADFWLTGGESRQESVRRALTYIEQNYSPSPETLVLVHDGARCLVSPELIARCLQGAEQHGAVTAVLKMKASVKRVSSEGRVLESLPREELVEVQTPQAFRFELLEEAHQRADGTGQATDDASLVEPFHPVWCISGEEKNIKITTPLDLSIASSLFACS